jgi:alpha-beta hydrolase superfamily lysophospholipase
MFEYFKNNYAWNLTAVTLIEEVGTISQPAQAFAVAAPFEDAPPEEANRAWHDAMSALGAKQEAIAEVDLAAGHPLTAARKFHRAASYFIRAERISSHEDPRQMVAYNRALQNYRKAREHGQDGVEFVEIPFEGAAMPAILIPANEEGRPAPIVVHIQGFDSIKETQFPVLQEYRRRGLSCLIVDQPGAGGALRLHGLVGRAETETYVTAIIDWIMARLSLATNRVGLVGLSMGGFFAPRAAAFEPRVKACASWGALFDAHRLVGPLAKGGDVSSPSVPNSIKHALWSFGLSTPGEFIELTKKLSLEGVIDRLTCPLLVIHGENDRQVPVEQAIETYEKATTTDKTLKIFTEEEGGDEHCQIDNRAIAADLLADWFAEKL